ncbi:hypothetical protein BDW71DRAFT_207739 [Aspergillus fruticulosus]
MPSALLWNQILTLILLLSALHRTVLAKADLDPDADADSSVKTYFTNPTSSSDSQAIPTYELGSVQNITWTTNLDVYNISIWQRSTGNVTGIGSESGGVGESSSVSIQGGNIFAQTTATERVDTFTWVVQTYSLDLTLSSIFYLSIEGDATSTSSDFNITTTPPSSSSSSNSSTTALPIPNPASTETASSLTSTGKIALGLGVGVGAPLITLLAILAYFQYRTGRRASRWHELSVSLSSSPDSSNGPTRGAPANTSTISEPKPEHGAISVGIMAEIDQANPAASL